MTIRTCDICGRRIDGPEDGVVRVNMGRPVLIDAHGKVAIPAEYELCVLCGGQVEAVIIEMRKKAGEGSAQ